jgi:hypothetical protein
MEETYKHHKIVASTWQLSDSGDWEPRVFVTWNEGQQQRSKPLVFTRAFSSEHEAELEGIKLAREWTMTENRTLASDPHRSIFPELVSYSCERCSNACLNFARSLYASSCSHALIASITGIFLAAFRLHEKPEKHRLAKCGAENSSNAR